MSSKTLLVVDDCETLRSAVRMLLENAGFRVVEAANGRVALEVVQREFPDLILLDVQMPVLDGWQTLGALRRDFRTALIPAIAMTGLDSFSRADLEEVGFCSLLSKPFTFSQLLGEVRRCLTPHHSPCACVDRPHDARSPRRAA